MQEDKNLTTLKKIGKVALYVAAYLLLVMILAIILPTESNGHTAIQVVIIIFGPIFLILFYMLIKNKRVSNGEEQTRTENLDVQAYPVQSDTRCEYHQNTAYTMTSGNWYADIDVMNGHDFEYLCADMLKQLGFYNVQVTRGSGDEGVDILAENKGLRYAFQCKRYQGNVGNSAIQQVFTGSRLYGASRSVVITNSFFTQQAKEQAFRVNVELWDRNVLFRNLSLAYPNSSYAQVYKKLCDEQRRIIAAQRAQEAKEARRAARIKRRRSNRSSTRNSGSGCLIWVILIIMLMAYIAEQNKDYSPYPSSEKTTVATEAPTPIKKTKPNKGN